MGVVYLGQPESGGEQVAIKTVRVPQRTNLSSIRAEIKALASLRHPGIVRIADFGVEGGAPWYAMELLHGQNLKEIFARTWTELSPTDGKEAATLSEVGSGLTEPTGGWSDNRHASAASTSSARLPTAAGGQLSDTLRIICELCRALSYLHENGLLHGDLKPSNIFIGRDGRVVLLDFGLVSQSRGGLGREVLGGAGAVRGTLPYLAPERLRGDFGDARADLFGVGVILFEALTGRLPFPGTRAAEILAAQQAGLVSLPSHLATGIPNELDRLAKNLLAFSPRDRLGHAEDVVAVLEALGAPSTAPVAASRAKTTYLYRPALVGRTDVLGKLVERLGSALGGQGGIVLLKGESGVGKTALMAEIGRRATQQHVSVVNGECIPIAAGGDAADIKEAPLHPFRAFLQDVADRCAEWPAATVEALLGPRGKLLARYEPALAAVPGADRFAEPADLPAEAELQRLLREISVLFKTLSSMVGPLVLLIDDLHWADELSIRLLQSLGPDFFRDNPTLIVATVRGDEMTSALRALATNDVVSTITLERLDELGVEEMIGGMLSIANPPAALVRFLSAHSEGNPFFVAEYLRLAVEEGIFVREGGHWKVARGARDLATGFETLTLPGSIRDLAERRLGGLAAEAREAVDVAAAIGRTFDIALLADVLGIYEAQALERLRDPMSFDIVQKSGPGTLRFVHDKLREAAYAGLPAPRKQDVHARVARAIEARCDHVRARLVERSAELVHHFKLAQDAGSALTYLELAGEAALRKSAHHDAAVFLEEAALTAERAGLAVTPDRRARWQRMLGDANLGLGKHDRSLVHFCDALSSLGAPVPAGKGALLGGVLKQLAIQVAHRLGVRPLPGEPNTDSPKLLEKVQIHDRLLQIYYYTGAELPRMMHAMACSLNLAELAGPSSYLALGYVNAGATTGILPAHRLADHYFGLARKAIAEHPNPEIETFVDLLEGHYRLSSGAFDRAAALLTHGMAVSERLGFARRWEENASVYGYVLASQARFEEALELTNRILASAERGDRQTRCWELTARSARLLVLGDPARARRDAELAAELAVGQLRAERLRANGALAVASLRCGDLEAAQRAADITTAEIDAGPPLDPSWLDPYCAVADVRFAVWNAGSEPQAARAAERAVRAIEKLAKVVSFASSRVELYRGRLLQRRGKKAAAQRAWLRGVELARASRLPYELALNEVALGASLAEGDPERRQHLDRAGSLLRQMGASPMLGIVESEISGRPISP